jgi:hypothetical protein
MVVTPERLKVSKSYEDDRLAVFLVESTSAISLCARGGFCKIDRMRAMALVDNMDRVAQANLRLFLARTRLSPFPLDTVDDKQLSILVRNHIRTGRLVAVRQDGESSQQTPSATTEQRRLIREIDSRLRGRLTFSGRRYKLVADVDLARIASRGEFEVVGRDEAVRVLAGMAAQHVGIDLTKLLHQASDKLTRDWRPPFGHPDGLILLRHVPVVAAVAVETTAITPSQMAKLAAAEETVNLEVVVLGLDDKPLAGLSYVIEAPDAETYEGELGASAKTNLTSAKKGRAGVVLKWIDG